MAYFINKQAPQSGLANLLAFRGRQGDTELVHMSKPELNVLRAMGQLSVNPRTGLPEAFNLQEAFSGIAGLLNQDMTGKEAMQELINFGRNKIAEFNVDEEEMIIEEMPSAPVPTMPMPTPAQQESMQGLPAMLAAGKKVGRTAPDGSFEGMIDIDDNGGDGMSDDIHFKVQNDPKIKNALLSRDEYVIPADVVSNLGNGSSDAGAEKLDKFLDNVRKDSTGTTKQIKQIDGDKKLRELI